MDINKIIHNRTSLETFIKSNERQFEFYVDCELKNRINFIYKTIFPTYKKYLFYVRFFISRIAYFIDYSPCKIFLYRLIGVNIGKGVFISPNVTIDVHFPKLIKISNYVILGYGVCLFTHDFYESKYRIGRIDIGEGAVIGAYSAIGCGVCIDDNVNIRMKSTVLKNVYKIAKK